MGFAVGQAFIPLADTPGIQEEVFGVKGRKGGATQKQMPTPEEQLEKGLIDISTYRELIKTLQNNGDGNSDDTDGRQVGMKVRKGLTARAPKNPMGRPERSVMLSHVTSGGRKTGKIVNRWGKAVDK